MAPSTDAVPAVTHAEHRSRRERLLKELGGAVGLAMVEADEPITNEFVTTGTWEVDVAGRLVPAVASLRPMYDPDNARIRA